MNLSREMYTDDECASPMSQAVDQQSHKKTRNVCKIDLADVAVQN